MKQRVLQINSKDNVLVALVNLKKSDIVQHHNTSYILLDDIPAKHKFFMNNMNAGDEVIMYGTLVGKMQTDLKSGTIMTTENTKHAAERYSYRAFNYQWQMPDVSKFLNKTFKGYHRSDGRVGTANYWIFLPTVFCENRNLDVIRDALQNELGYSVTDKYRRYTRELVETFKN